MRISGWIRGAGQMSPRGDPERLSSEEREIPHSGAVIHIRLCEQYEQLWTESCSEYRSQIFVFHLYMLIILSAISGTGSCGEISAQFVDSGRLDERARRVREQRTGYTHVFHTIPTIRPSGFSLETQSKSKFSTFPQSMSLLFFINLWINQ